jgi:hypothetical protein
MVMFAWRDETVYISLSIYNTTIRGKEPYEMQMN